MMRIIAILLFASSLYAGGNFIAASSQAINVDRVVNDAATNTNGTIIAFFEFKTGGSNQDILGFGDTNVLEYLRIGINPSNQLIGTLSKAGTTQWNIRSNAAITNGWHCVALVQNGVSPILYIDNVAVAITVITNTNLTFWVSALAGVDNCRIGAINTNDLGNVDLFNNKIAFVRYYNRTLNQQEIQEICVKRGGDNLYTIAHGCVGAWDLLGGATGAVIAKAVDKSGYVNDGIGINGPVYTADPIKLNGRRR